MSRTSTGSVVVKRGKRGTVYALRFRALGRRQYVTLGKADDGWDHQRAETELRHVLADVERGRWQPATEASTSEPREIPTFHEFASEWLERRRPDLKPKTIVDYEWALSLHLLPEFADYRLDAIGIREVDRYKAWKLREGKLQPNAINKTIARLAQILDEAIEDGHMGPTNPAKGWRRRARGTKPRRTWVEPEQLPSLLEAASPQMRPILATMVGAGLRLGEAVALTWGDLNLAAGTLTVQASKTPAGEGREIDLPEGLRDELVGLRLRSEAIGKTDPVFLNSEGRKQTGRNVEARIKTAIKTANERLADLEIAEIDPRVTPHSLRRTYASLRAALRDDPVYIAHQMGHRKPDMTFTAYQRAVKRRGNLTGKHAAEFDRALAWASHRNSGSQIEPAPTLATTNDADSAARIGH